MDIQVRNDLVMQYHSFVWQTIRNPLNMPVDDFVTTTGPVMILRKMAFEHAPTEIGFVPGNFFGVAPSRGRRTANNVEQDHF